MTEPLRYIHIGVGGFGQHWCTDVLPRLRDLGLAMPAAAVDINPEALVRAREQLGLGDDRLYTNAKQALGERKADFITIVVPPALHEEMVDLAVEQSLGQPQVQVIADRKACSRYGINVSEILELVELAIGGEVIDNIYLNTRRFGIHVRYQEPYRSDPQVIENLLVHTESGNLVPLKEVAQVREVIGPIQINREQNQRRWIIQGNVRGRDLGGVIADIKQRIDDEVDLPAGYFIEYGGQFENQQRAMARLSIIVPVVLALIFLLLYLTFGSMKEAFLIIMNVPLALIGGVFGLYLMKEYLSVPAAVGFIALFGIAVQNGVVLVSYINQLRQQGMQTREVIAAGALQRLRPVLMTAMTTVLGLLPLLLSRGIGSEVQRPLASVVVFGLTSATILTLFVIPAFYPWFAARVDPKE